MCDVNALEAKNASGYFLVWASLAFLIFHIKMHDLHANSKKTMKTHARLDFQTHAKARPDIPDMAVLLSKTQDFYFFRLNVVLWDTCILWMTSMGYMNAMDDIHGIPVSHGCHPWDIIPCNTMCTWPSWGQVGVRFLEIPRTI